MSQCSASLETFRRFFREISRLPTGPDVGSCDPATRPHRGPDSGARSRRPTMTLKIGDVAPNFAAETTEGRINFHDWIGNSWCALFSHPKDFTPVCTTELGYMARI